MTKREFLNTIATAELVEFAADRHYAHRGSRSY